MEEGRCSRCGGTSVATGALQGLTRVSFRPDATRVTLQISDIMTKATMCRTCGLVEITGDTTKLQRMVSDVRQEGQPAV